MGKDLRTRPLIDVLTVYGPESLAGLRSEWNDLADRCPCHYLSQNWRWAADAWMVVAAPSGHELRILALREGDCLVALWPLVICRRAGFRIVRQLGSESSEYTSPLCEIGPRQHEYVARLWHAAHSLGDVLVLCHVRSDNPLADLLGRHPFRSFPEKPISAPWIARADYGQWADYLATLSTSRLSGLRRKRRRLAEVGHLDVKLHPGPVSEALIDSLLAHKKAWMSRHGLSCEWLERSAYRAFLLALVSGADSRDGLQLFSLSVNGTPIAFQLNAVEVRRVEFLIGAFDGRWARYSPGQILMMECIRWSFERGLDYDFRIGDEPYKSTWARRDTPTFDCKVGLSHRGTAALWLMRFYRKVQRRLRALAGRLRLPSLRATRGTAAGAVAPGRRHGDLTGMEI